MDHSYLVSVLIPTKNRQKYAAMAVEQALKIKSNRLQVILQDNSETDTLREMVGRFGSDRRFRYHYTEESISTVDNFNKAIENSDGEYVCIIGDDDGVTRQIIEVAAWASDNNIDAVRPALSAVYCWPGSGVRKQEKDTGCLSIHRITAKATTCDPALSVRKLLAQGCQQYLLLDLVKLYHGMVRRKCLDDLKAKTGRYFAGLSPDIYMAVCLSLMIRKLVVLDFPLTISGICKKSTSADAATGKHTGKWEDAPHFSGHDDYHWSEVVPKFYSVETIWADSALAALQDMKREDLKDEFNLTALTAYCYLKYPAYRDVIVNHYYSRTSKPAPNLALLVSVVKYPMGDFAKRVTYWIKRSLNGFVRVYGCRDIIDANEKVQKCIAKCGLDQTKLERELVDALEK